MDAYIDKVVDVPVAKQRQVPAIQKDQKPATVVVIETVEKIANVPVIKQVDFETRGLCDQELRGRVREQAPGFLKYIEALKNA